MMAGRMLSLLRGLRRLGLSLVPLAPDRRASPPLPITLPPPPARTAAPERPADLDRIGDDLSDSHELRGDAGEAVQALRLRERARCKAIILSPHAEGKLWAAQHLAFETATPAVAVLQRIEPPSRPLSLMERMLMERPVQRRGGLPGTPTPPPSGPAGVASAERGGAS